MSDKPLIIQCDIFALPEEELLEVRNLIIEQMKDGVVVIPSGFRMAAADENVLKMILSDLECRRATNHDLGNYDIETGVCIAMGIVEKYMYELKGDSK